MKSRRYAKLVNKLIELRKLMVINGATIHQTSFTEIEEWAGTPLPPSAYAHRAWWSNNDGNYSNTLKPWDLARLSTADVDMEAKTLAFSLWVQDAELARNNRLPFDRAAFLAKFNHARSEITNEPPLQSGLEDVARPYLVRTDGRHPLRGALKGTLRIVAGTDLTAPADPEWADKT